MTTLTSARVELNKNKVNASKENIVTAALSVAAKPGGWSKLTREKVAAEAGCGEALVSKYFGTMATFRRTVMRAAIRHAINTKSVTVAYDMNCIIAQGIAAGDKCALRIPDSLKTAALKTLAG